MASTIITCILNSSWIPLMQPIPEELLSWWDEEPISPTGQNSSWEDRWLMSRQWKFSRLKFLFLIMSSMRETILFFWVNLQVWLTLLLSFQQETTLPQISSVCYKQRWWQRVGIPGERILSPMIVSNKNSPFQTMQVSPIRSPLLLERVPTVVKTTHDFG